MDERHHEEEYDEDGDLVNVLVEDGEENIWLFTKGIYKKFHAKDLRVLAEGKWHTLNDLREIRRSNNAN